MRSKLALALCLASTACHSGSDSAATTPEPLVINRGLSVSFMDGDGELRLLSVREADEGRDLDGDGDLEDLVLHILDLGTGALTSTGLAVPSRPLRGDVPPPAPLCSDSLGVFLVSEPETGRDLDQDGRVLGVQTWTFDRRTGRLDPLPFFQSATELGGDLAAFLVREANGEFTLRVLDARDGSLTVLPSVASELHAVADGLVAYGRSENGALDLNADGDVTDFRVVHVHDRDSGRIVNTSFDAHPHDYPQIRGGYVGFHVLELQHGGRDLNGDGDADDEVFVAVNGRNGLERMPGLALTRRADLGFRGSTEFLLEAREVGDDRNGDGDRDDWIAVAYDPVTDRVYDTGLAISGGPMVRAGRWLGVSVSEQAQGDSDLDGDGLTLSFVSHVFDTVTGRRTNLGLYGAFLGSLGDELLGVRIHPGPQVRLELFVWDGPARATRFLGVGALDARGTARNQALLRVREQEEDRNGDGDLGDVVMALYDAATGSVRNLGLAGLDSYSSLGPSGRAAVLVSEADQGHTDLNGDGDAFDLVLHEIVLDPPMP